MLNVPCRLSVGLYLAWPSGWTLDPCCSLVSSPAYGHVSICSCVDALVGPWIWCTICLVLDYWWTLLPAPISAHHVQTLWDCALLVRALPGPGSPLPPRLFPPWGAAVSHCSLMLAVQRFLLPWSPTHRFSVLMCRTAASCPYWSAVPLSLELCLLRDIYYKPGPLCLTSQAISTTVRGSEHLRSQHTASPFPPGVVTSPTRPSIYMYLLPWSQCHWTERYSSPPGLFLLCQVMVFCYPLRGVLFALCGWDAGSGRDVLSFIFIWGDVSNWHVSLGIRGKKKKKRSFKPLRLLRDGCFNFESLHACRGYYPGKLDFQIWQQGKKGDAQKIEGI